MALNFPTSPELNQVYTSGTRSWRWDGSSWVANNSVTNILGYVPVNKAGDTMSGGLNVPNVNAVTVTANSSGFSIAGGSSSSKTLTVSNGVTIAGTDGSTLNIGTGGTLLSGAFQASSQGTTGAQGVQGTTGIQGSVGTQGTLGTQGSTGAQGTVGGAGIQGSTGSQGTGGAQGATGSQGAQGVQGTQGRTGAQGSTGTQGAVGSTGGTGATGSTGVQGTTGATGAQGTSGATILGNNQTWTGNNVFSSRLSVGPGSYYSGMKTGALELGDTGQNYLYTGGWSASMGAGILASCLDQWEINIHDSGHRIVSPFAFYGGASNNYIMMGRDIGWGTTFIEAAQSFRAPIFYDSNDTSYYCNPNATSALYDLTLIGAKNTYLYINPGNGAEAMVRYNGGSGSGWYVGKRVTSQYVGTESFHFYSEAAGSTVGGIDTSGNFIVSGSHRAPIFYDSNNTGYYCDPNSTSNFAGLTVANTITGNISGSSGSTTYASYPAFSGDSVDKDNLTTRTESGFYQSSSGTNAEGWPRNDSTWQHMIACTHTNDGNYYSMQLGAGFFNQNLYYRSTNGNGSTGWTEVLIANSGSYSGSLTMSGNITAYSDLKLKQNIFTIDFALEKVKNLRGVYYTRKDDETNKRKIGVIAQEIELVLPEVVMKNVKEETKEETLSVDYGNITALLIEAIKEQQQQIENQQKQIEELRSLINNK